MSEGKDEVDAAYAMKN
nr:unnamed protein product [Callosobruchus analis]